MSPASIKLAIILLCSSSLHAATTITSETVPFQTLGSATDNLSTSNGETTFFNSGNQGSGITLDPSAGDTNPFTVTAPTYFEFSSRIGGTFSEIFFGAVGNTPNSSDGVNANSTAFALRISLTGIEIFGQGSAAATFSPMAALGIGDLVNYSVVVTPSVQNGSQIILDYDIEIEVDATGETFSETGIRANQNGQSASAVEDYTFNAIGTRNNSGGVQQNIVGPVTISDMPIVAAPVPEPSGSLLAALSLMGLAFIRRRS